MISTWLWVCRVTCFCAFGGLKLVGELELLSVWDDDVSLGGVGLLELRGGESCRRAFKLGYLFRFRKCEEKCIQVLCSRVMLF